MAVDKKISQLTLYPAPLPGNMTIPAIVPGGPLDYSIQVKDIIGSTPSLPPSGNLSGSEQITVVQGGNVTQTTAQAIAALAPAIPVTFGYVLNSGNTGTNVAPILISPRAGSLTKCKVVTKASDAATALTFKINKNGVDVFAVDPTVAANTSPGTISTFTNLTSTPLTVAADDTFTIDVTSGTATWQVTILLE